MPDRGGGERSDVGGVVLDDVLLHLVLAEDPREVDDTGAMSPVVASRSLTWICRTSSRAVRITSIANWFGSAAGSKFCSAW